MKLSASDGCYTPSAEFAGVATNDDFVLAVDIAGRISRKSSRLYCSPVRYCIGG